MTKLTVTERMIKLETKVEGISSNLITHTKNQRDDFDKVFEKLDNLSSSFAGKWVEKIVIGLLITIIAGIVLAILI